MQLFDGLLEVGEGLRHSVLRLYRIKFLKDVRPWEAVILRWLVESSLKLIFLSNCFSANSRQLELEFFSSFACLSQLKIVDLSLRIQQIVQVRFAFVGLYEVVELVTLVNVFSIATSYFLFLD